MAYSSTKKKSAGIVQISIGILTVEPQWLAAGLSQFSCINYCDDDDCI